MATFSQEKKEGRRDNERGIPSGNYLAPGTGVPADGCPAPGMP
jgi:hypothetical protein